MSWTVEFPLHAGDTILASIKSGLKDLKTVKEACHKIVLHMHWKSKLQNQRSDVSDMGVWVGHFPVMFYRKRSKNTELNGTENYGGV